MADYYSHIAASMYRTTDPPVTAGASCMFGLCEIPSYGYTGPLLRLRRSSDGVEQDFYQNGSKFTLSTVRGGGTAYATWRGASSVTVVRWYSQDGSGRYAEQTTVTKQPIFSVSGTDVTLNGLPALRFDNANARELTLSASTTANESFTQIMIGKRTALSTALIGLTDGAGTLVYFTHWNNNAVFNKSNSGTLLSMVNDTTSTQAFWTGIMAGATRTTRKNGVAISASFTSSAVSANFTTIGRLQTVSTDGEIQFVALWPSSLNAVITTTETNINTLHNNIF
jgi:hypothetical protein